jgi:hypothetical protein
MGFLRAVTEALVSYGTAGRARAPVSRRALVRLPTILALASFASATQGTSRSAAATTTTTATTRAQLQPGTTHHYRALAASPAGTRRGGNRAFSTAEIRLSLTMAVAPNPVVFGNPFLVEGNLSGANFANHERKYEIVLQVNPFPYLTGFRPVGEPELTNDEGGFSFPFSGLLENAQVRVVTAGKPLVSSPAVLESVAVRVSFHARATRRGGFVRLYGTVAPAEVGAPVGFQLLKPGQRSVNEGGTVLKAGTFAVSSFSRAVRVPHGLYRAFVKVSDGAHVSNYSAPILIP